MSPDVADELVVTSTTFLPRSWGTTCTAPLIQRGLCLKYVGVTLPQIIGTRWNALPHVFSDYRCCRSGCLAQVGDSSSLDTTFGVRAHCRRARGRYAGRLRGSWHCNRSGGELMHHLQS